eukprot:2348174-Prymnesium_polylepis.2
MVSSYLPNCERTSFSFAYPSFRAMPKAAPLPAWKDAEPTSPSKYLLDKANSCCFRASPSTCSGALYRMGRMGGISVSAVTESSPSGMGY